MARANTNMRESEVERRCCAWVASQGGIALKIQAAKGWPDRLFIKHPGKVMFIEFKAPGKTPGPLQAWTLQRLALLGCHADWCNSVETFKRMYDAL